MSNNKGVVLFLGTMMGLSFANGVRAVEDCDNGVNLSNGDTFKNFTGVVTCRDRDTHQLRRQITYKDGKQNGEEIFYDWDTGKKRSSIFYVDNERHGPHMEYDLGTGEVIEQSTFVHGSQTGLEKHFFPDGKIKSITYDANDGSIDTRLEYDKNGKLSDIQCGPYSIGPEDVEICGRNGQIGTAIAYRENGQMSYKRQFLKGMRHGLSETYGNKAQTLSQESWKAGKRDGIWKAFRDDGTLARQEEYVNDVREGEQLEFFADGKAKKTSEIIRDRKKVAETTWYQNGHVARQEEQKGQLREVREYYDNGQLSREATLNPTLNQNYSGNAWVGVEKQYHENGKLGAEIHYTDKGQRQGVTEYYYANGQLANKETWDNGVLQQKITYDQTGKKLSDESYYPDGSRKH